MSVFFNEPTPAPLIDDKSASLPASPVDSVNVPLDMSGGGGAGGAGVDPLGIADIADIAGGGGGGGGGGAAAAAD